MIHDEIEREFELGEMPVWEEPAVDRRRRAEARAVPIRRPRGRKPAAAPAPGVTELIRQAIKVAATRKGKGSREVAITELVLLEVLRDLITHG